MKKQQQKKQAGFIVTTELMLIGTILVIGMIVGLVAVRDAVTAEMGDLAEAIGAIDQSYTFDGIYDSGTNAAVSGTAWGDNVDNAGGVYVQGVQGFAGDEQGIDFEFDAGTGEGTQQAPLP